MTNDAALVYDANEAATISWLDDCDGDVDFTAFSDECYRIAFCVAQAAGMPRVPLGTPPGVLALEFAAAVANRHVDPRIYAANVPGAATFRQIIGA